jgi:arginine-tRNA-protein transferase
MTRARRQLMLYQSPPHPCSYLDGRSASSVFIDPEAQLGPDSYGMLLNLGFRRSGTHVYRPQCPDCQACMSARIPVADFQPRRSQRRTLQANADLQLHITQPRFDPEHYALYQAYTGQRHDDGEMARASTDEYRDFLIADWCQTEFMEFRLAGRLVALAVTDRVPDGLSAVYTFFDPGLAARSLGVFAVLSQIRRASELGLPYLYLGYWIGNCRKMRYKADYRPLQLLLDGRWQTFAPGQPLPEPETMTAVV